MGWVDYLFPAQVAPIYDWEVRDKTNPPPGGDEAAPFEFQVKLNCAPPVVGDCIDPLIHSPGLPVCIDPLIHSPGLPVCIVGQVRLSPEEYEELMERRVAAGARGKSFLHKGSGKTMSTVRKQPIADEEVRCLAPQTRRSRERKQR